MLGAVGDMVEDVVVHLREQVNVASDTAAVVVRRRGGSAANMVAAACLAGGAARFIGQVGDDAIGQWLTTQLAGAGAELAVRRTGRSGTIVVLLDVAGERTMLSDRATCTDLADPDPAWLDGLHTLHIPYYSLVGEPLATTAATLAAWAGQRGITVSIDASSASLLQRVGPEQALAHIRSLRPTVVLANELEAATLGPGLHPDHLDGALVVVKQGAEPAIVLQPGRPPVTVPAMSVDGVRDTTGAGDAFAAGLLLALADGADPIEATQRAHRVAADAVRRASAQGSAGAVAGG
ncbi:MAG: carbohydrate kinase family protein [Actinomycetota bacterium]|nr:carbohydrate kinase family protein [Actinomycetota bacterium]